MIQINKEKFNTIFQSYKENFIKYFPYEKYKWIAVKQFQSKWNLEATNFTEYKDT